MQRVDERRIDLVRRLHARRTAFGAGTVDIEEQAPVDGPVSRKEAESIQPALLHTGEDEESAGDMLAVSRIAQFVFGIQPIDRSHHRMPEAIGRRRELDRHEWIVVEVVEAEIRLAAAHIDHQRIFPDRTHCLLADDPRQKIVQHNVLIVPPHVSLNLRELPVRMIVCDTIVKAQKCRLQL